MLQANTISDSIDTDTQMAEQFSTISIPHSILSIVSYNIAMEHFSLPYSMDEKGRLRVILAKGFSAETIQTIQLCIGYSIRPTTLDKADVVKLIAKHYGALATENQAVQKEKPDAKRHERLTCNPTGSAIGIVNDIIHEAIRLRASDIHLEPFEREMLIRFRIDGVLQEMMSVSKDRILEVVSRIKIIARLNIAEKRRSQDGRIRITENHKDVDIRVSTMPTDFGEKIVLRILDKSGSDHSIDSIGMDATRLTMFKKAVTMPNGIVLLTGPTGSGKTTTLYGIINYIKKPGLNISTIEDPIEYNIPGVNQTQVSMATGMTFAHSLRTFLRQDPDIIMVGEMRDQETAEIAIRASLTGHLVLSTLHTNDAPSAITRLVDMGIEPYLISSSVTMIVAQRLVRRICHNCKCEDRSSAEVKTSMGLLATTPVFKGVGCSLCGHTGYKGRVGIFEVMPVTETIRQLINNKSCAADIRGRAINEGMVLLRDNALSYLVDGATSIEEVSRETSVIT
ncbi:MAG TPA: type II secretion system protein GspE [Fibrobacteres bacterium]|nr:type II secretion system protein GspE [Fibrobacterota bacterium]